MILGIRQSPWRQSTTWPQLFLGAPMTDQWPSWGGGGGAGGARTGGAQDGVGGWGQRAATPLQSVPFPADGFAQVPGVTVAECLSGTMWVGGWGVDTNLPGGGSGLALVEGRIRSLTGCSPLTVTLPHALCHIGRAHSLAGWLAGCLRGWLAVAAAAAV